MDGPPPLRPAWYRLAAEGSAPAGLPVAEGAQGPLVWWSTDRPTEPDHDPVDLAAELPAGPDAVAERRFDVSAFDPALVVENGFDAAHVTAVHHRAAPRVDDPTFAGDRACIRHHDPASGATTTFVAYRAAQLLVEVGTSRPELELWVMATIEVGTPRELVLRYQGHGPGAEATVRRFAEHHAREMARDLELFAHVRPERGGAWGPGDGPLRAYREWLEGFGR